MNNYIKFFAFVVFVLAMAAGVMTVPFVASEFVYRFFQVQYPMVHTSPATDSNTSRDSH